MKSIINKSAGTESSVKTENKPTGKNKALYAITILILFIFQTVSGKLGGLCADLLPLEKIDPDSAFAEISVHHITMMLIALIVIIILARLLKVKFGFCPGDIKKGTRYVLIYSAVFVGIALIIHIFMLIGNNLPVYEYPLNQTNILGTLGFQLFLSGPAEEILYRALPITVLVYLSGKSIPVKWGISLETIVAAFLFAIAHMKWSLFPPMVEANFFPLLYAFVLGIIQGKAYEDSRSIIYPMLMHSISNVLMVGTGYLFILLQ